MIISRSGFLRQVKALEKHLFLTKHNCNIIWEQGCYQLNSCLDFYGFQAIEKKFGSNMDRLSHISYCVLGHVCILKFWAQHANYLFFPISTTNWKVFNNHCDRFSYWILYEDRVFPWESSKNNKRDLGISTANLGMPSILEFTRINFDDFIYEGVGYLTLFQWQ